MMVWSFTALQSETVKVLCLNPILTQKESELEGVRQELRTKEAELKTAQEDIQGLLVDDCRGWSVICMHSRFAT